MMTLEDFAQGATLVGGLAKGAIKGLTKLGNGKYKVELENGESVVVPESSIKVDADGRPTWRQSEIDEAKKHVDKAREQVSFKDGEEVPNGIKGSVKPDIVTTDKAIEVKNYKVENSSNMVNTIVKQVKQRDCHLPGCLKQEVVIDFRGQDVTVLQRDKIRQSIINKTDGILGPKDIKFRVEDK